MNITEEEINNLKATKCADDWNAVCDKIKKDRYGKWPPDWYKRVLAVGLPGIVKASW